MDLIDSSASFAEQMTDEEGMTALLDGAYDYWEPQRGEIVQGHVMQISPSEILVDIGAKAEGVVAGRELQHIEPDVLHSLDVGSEVLAYVVTPEDRDGNILLSLSRARLESDWRLAESRLEKEEIFESTVAAYNKGGLLVHLGRVRGFVPASQIDRRHWDGETSDLSLEERLAKLVGQEMQLKVIEIDRGRNRLIFSERAALNQYRQAQKGRLLEELEEGQVKRGVVTNLCDFGAFVDLGGVDGLVHLSELAWGRVGGPADVLQVGQSVDVYVLSVDRERERIGLSLKRLQPEPWSQVEELYQVGQVVEGEVTNLAKFGAFVRLDGSDIEGLVHISEFSDAPVSHPSEVVERGERVAVEIIRIESDRHRIGLSMKNARGLQELDVDEEPEDGGEIS